MQVVTAGFWQKEFVFGRWYPNLKGARACFSLQATNERAPVEMYNCQWACQQRQCKHSNLKPTDPLCKLTCQELSTLNIHTRAASGTWYACTA